MSDHKCIGCGVCNYLYPGDFSRVKNRYGDFEINTSEFEKLNIICPIGNDPINKKTGFEKYYIGHITSKKERKLSSSGGITSYLLETLLYKEEVTAVIHAGFDEGNSIKCKYKISRTIGQINSNKGTKYQLITLDQILPFLGDKNEKVAFVGTPCHIDALKRMASVQEINVKYYISLMCGQQKLEAYTNYLIDEVYNNDYRNIKKIDFRSKDEAKYASDYSFEVTDTTGQKYRKKSKSYKYNDWGLGFLKPEACDSCKNILAENADITIGDAWVRPYSSDPLGHNVLIVRNKELDHFLKDRSKIKVNSVDFNSVIKSQLGTINHRTIGYRVRIGEEQGALNTSYYKYRATVTRRTRSEFLENKKISLMTKLYILIYKYAFNNRIYAFLRKR